MLFTRGQLSAWRSQMGLIDLRYPNAEHGSAEDVEMDGRRKEVKREHNGSGRKGGRRLSQGGNWKGIFFFFPSCLSISHPLIHISPTSFILNLAFPICSSLSLTHTHTHTHTSLHTQMRFCLEEAAVWVRATAAGIRDNGGKGKEECVFACVGECVGVERDKMLSSEVCVCVCEDKDRVVGERDKCDGKRDFCVCLHVACVCR